jgi:uncharacterized protein YecT (DUF1311 family)
MRKVLIVLLYLIFNFNINAQTQQDLNQDAQKKYKLAEDEINMVYKEIIQKYKTDSLFVKNLRVSQRIWIQFRDAEIKMKYPSNDPYVEYGSIYPVCYYSYMEILTRERIQKLTEWLSKKKSVGCMHGEH